MARLGPLVTEELGARHRLGLGLGLARTIGAEHVQVEAGPQVGLPHDRLGARGHAGHDVAGERVVEAAHLPAELAGERPGRLGIGVEADARAVLGGGEAARRPGSVQPAADDAGARRVLASQLLRRHRGHRAGPQRRDRAHVDERERLAVGADDTQIIPITTGRPASGLRGNEVTHLRIASPAPLAGIARKSPCGAASR